MVSTYDTGRPLYSFQYYFLQQNNLVILISWDARIAIQSVSSSSPIRFCFLLSHLCCSSLYITIVVLHRVYNIPLKGKRSFYMAQYPVSWTAQSALHFLPSLTDLFIPTPTRLLREAFSSQAGITRQYFITHISTTVYSQVLIYTAE